MRHLTRRSSTCSAWGDADWGEHTYAFFSGAVMRMKLEEWYVTLCVAQETLRPTVSTDAFVFVADHGCKKADAALSPWTRTRMEGCSPTIE